MIGLYEPIDSLFGDCFIDAAIQKRLLNYNDINKYSIQHVRRLGWLALMDQNNIYKQFYDCLYRKELWITRNNIKAYE